MTEAITFTVTRDDESAKDGAIWMLAWSNVFGEAPTWHSTEDGAQTYANGRLDRLVWQDAYRMAWVGASNPTAVAATIAKWSATFTRIGGTDAAKNHQAIQAMVGQLLFLFHQGLGPKDDVMDTLTAKVREYGLDQS